MKSIAMIVGAFAILTSSAAAFAQTSLLGPTWYLFPGEKLLGSGCFYETVMQSDGNLVTYDNASTGGGSAVWQSGTQGSGAAYGTMQTDGNFVLYTAFDVPVWATNTSGQPGNKLVQENTGDLVVQSTNGQVRWQSGVSGEALGQSPCETVGSKMEVDQNTDMPGNDYTHFQMAFSFASMCGNSCAQDTRCHAFTYVPPGVQGPLAVCWLKTAPATRVAHTGMVSGHK
jgi:hypothetical protein